jgi:hypothetical protein
MNNEAINRTARLAFGIVVLVAIVAGIAWYALSDASTPRTASTRMTPSPGSSPTPRSNSTASTSAR